MEQLLRRELKTWQKAFKAQHGRDPTKRDILADPAIAGTYDTWQAVGGDANAKPKHRPRDDSQAWRGASSSKQRLDGHDDVVKTPSKRRVREVGTVTLSKNPFRTPTKAKFSPSTTATTPGGKSRNPFASPSKAPAEVVSPARSMIEVELTPTKRSPLLETRRNHFTPSKSPSRQQYITSSPSKLRTTLASRRTPTKSPSRQAAADAALNAALVAYTPRTKARKRLRGEDVPPTPNRRVVSQGGVARTEPRQAAVVQKGLGAFGFASASRKGGRKSDSAAVFSRARGGQETEAEMHDESPIKAVAKVRGPTTSGKGFRPLFASPTGKQGAQVVLGASFAARGSVGSDDDADAVMEDETGSPVGGLFAAEVHQRRLRRAREGESSAESVEGQEGLGKKHKVRAALQLPSSSDSDEDIGNRKAGMVSSSPAPYRRGGATSSPNTELTVPSSTVRPSAAGAVSLAKLGPSSSPTRRSEQANREGEDATPANGTAVEAWRKVHRVELSDEDEPVAHSQKPVSGRNSEGRKKVISITPYQLYGSLRTSSPLPPSSHSEGEEEDFSPYSLLTQPKRGLYAVDPTSTNPDSDSDDNLSAHASLAGLQLSPVRHAPSSKRDKEQRNRLLNSLFDPASAKNRRLGKALNPEARFGPLQPSAATADSDDGENNDDDSAQERHTAKDMDDDDDDDWQQEVEEDFTFLDSEIELQDVA